AAFSQLLQKLQCTVRVKTMRQREHQELAFGKVQEITEFQVALALLGVALAAGEQLAQPAVSRPVARIDKNVRRAIDEDESRADQEFWFGLNVRIIELAIGAHDAGERVVIGDADRRKFQGARLMHVILWMRAAAQEGEIRGDADLGIGNGHANSPCTYQL